MEMTILDATERTRQPGKFREKGFVAGVLYGDDMAGANSVKFESKALDKVLASHGSHAKVWIKYNHSQKFGFIKEVQRDAISGFVTHIDVQMVSKDHEIKLQIPVIFKGEDVLGQRKLQLQVYKPEVTVLGKMGLIPDTVQVDISAMELGDSITLNHFALDKLLKVSEKEDVVYGVIINQPLTAEVETESR
ncbi:MAG: 50S ribosomal protein L25 [Syntrophomonadaceae bacterium]|nr:50S ribosomal protein L25 [Syntrophomonadaceae bacterium]